MSAGSLDRRITFQSATVAAGTLTADQTQTWVNHAAVWARREELKGRELFAAQQVNAQITTRYTIRHRTDLHPKMRIVDSSRTYDILSIIESGGRNHWLQIMASARDSST